MFLWEVSWAPTSLDFENTLHCHVQPASWSNKRVTLVVLLINAQPCSYWVNIATGANYPAMELIGPILPEVDIFPKKDLKISEKYVDAMNIVPFLVPESYTFYTAAFSDNWEALPVSPWYSKEGRCHRLRCCQQVTQLVNVKLNLSWAVSSPLWLEPQQLQYALYRVVKLQIWYKI